MRVHVRHAVRIEAGAGEQRLHLAQFGQLLLSPSSFFSRSSSALVSISASRS